jgi:hypothetical protein
MTWKRNSGRGAMKSQPAHKSNRPVLILGALLLVGLAVAAITGPIASYSTRLHWVMP